MDPLHANDITGNLYAHSTFTVNVMISPTSVCIAHESLFWLCICRNATGNGLSCATTTAQRPHNAEGRCSESTGSTGHLNSA